MRTDNLAKGVKRNSEQIRKRYLSEDELKRRQRSLVTPTSNSRISFA